MTLRAMMIRFEYDSYLKCLYDSAIECQKRIKQKYQLKRKELKACEEPNKDNDILDEENNFLYKKSTLIEIEIENLAQSLQYIRQIFIIAVYHYWEKFIEKYSSKEETENGKHNTRLRAFSDFEKESKKLGFFTDKDMILVNKLSNLFKHNSDSSIKYIEDNIELFNELKNHDFDSDFDDFFIKEHNKYFISENLLERIFNIIQRSGPISE